MDSDKKDLAIGVDDFASVVRESYYVDKTSLVSFIVKKTSSSCFLFARPRRFGKSLALSMLRSFFEESKEDKSLLFKDTKIYEDKQAMESYFMKFPVVFLNFKDAIGESKEYLSSKLRGCIKDEYGRHIYLLDSPILKEYEKAYIDNLLNDRLSEADFSSSIKKLIGFLRRHHDKRVIVLIDEYDTPIRYAYENGFYKEVISLFKSLYGEALKSNSDVYYAILTGILQVSKESIFSGLNNLVVNTVLDSSLEEAFGFSKEEVEGLLRHYGMENKRDSFEEWYDGYRFGNAKIYNPLSVLSAISNGGKMGPYWTNTSEKNALYGLLSNSSSLPWIGNLLNEKMIKAKLDLSISYLDLSDSPDYLASYLVSTGYLTPEETLVDGDRILRIPNKEIESVFEKEIVFRYVKQDGNDLVKKLQKAFEMGNKKDIKYLFETHLLTNISYYELNHEKSYQIMTASVLSLVLKDYKIRTEVNSGLGRGDILAIPNDQDKPGYIFEIKWLKGKTSSKRLVSSAESALRQIVDKGYVNEFKNTHVRKAICIGISFSQRNAEVAAKKINLKVK